MSHIRLIKKKIFENNLYDNNINIKKSENLYLILKVHFDTICG